MNLYSESGMRVKTLVRMKSVFCVLLFLLAMISMSACSRESDRKDVQDEEFSIIGEWADLMYYEEGYDVSSFNTYHFYEDGTYDEYFQPYDKVLKASDKYELNEKVLKMSYGEETETYILQISNDKGFLEVHGYYENSDYGKAFVLVRTEDVEKAIASLSLLEVRGDEGNYTEFVEDDAVAPKEEKEVVYIRTVERGCASSGEIFSLINYGYDNQGRLLGWNQDFGYSNSIFDEETMTWSTTYGAIDGVVDSYFNFEYDMRGNLVKYNAPRDAGRFRQESEFKYGVNGIEEVIISNNEAPELCTKLELCYDRDGNLTECYRSNDEGEQELYFKLDYDSEGRLIQEILIQEIRMMVKGDWIYNFAYNEDGQVEEYVVSRGSPTYNAKYEYSSVGEEQHLYLQYTDSGDLLEVTEADGEVLYRYDYDDEGRLLSKEYHDEYHDGRYYEFFYDGDQLTSGEETFTSQDGTVQKLAEYTYDENGCLIKVRYETGEYREYEYEELTLSEEDAQRFYRQQQMLLRSSQSLDWAYQNYDNPIHYIIPSPVNPALFTGPATLE